MLKPRTHNVLLVLFLSALFVSQTAIVLAQEAPAQPEPCSDAQFSGWDFWLGIWNVYPTATYGTQEQTLLGINKINKTQQGCVITEDWASVQGGTGFSTNFYNPVTDLWTQHWHSSGAGGYFIDYSGGLDESGAMVLEGKIFYFGTKTEAPFRGKWTLQEDGTVRQQLWQQTPGGNWNVWFDGTYEKRIPKSY